jgi:beta-glucanase (GH16 family)
MISLDKIFFLKSVETRSDAMRLQWSRLLAVLWVAGCGVSEEEKSLAQVEQTLAGFEVSTPLSLNKSITLLAPATSRLTVTKPLSLNPSAPVVGGLLQGTVTYQNTGTSPLSIQTLVIAARRPDGSAADFSPALHGRTLQPGESVTLTSTRTLDQAGTWKIFSSDQGADGAWHEQAPTSVEVKTGTPPPSNWRLVWQDEFDGSGLPDPARWGYEVGYVRNSELQYYTQGRLENARRENGQLILEARRDGWNGHDITSASIITKGKKSFLYGRIEVRARLPTGKGTWPAFWMLGTNIDQVGWPACGEIDIMENVGYQPTTVHGTVHTPFYYHGSSAGPRGGNTQASSPWLDYHLYAIEWFPDHIDFFVDSVKYFSFFNEGTSAKWPFDKPHYLLLNLAIGGSWGGSQGVDLSLFPHRVYVDYVRVYERPG